MLSTIVLVTLIVLISGAAAASVLALLRASDEITCGFDTLDT